MPIRMEKDPNEGRNQRPGQGRSNPLINWLPMILLFVFRKPKIAIPILLIGAVWYFFMGGQEMLGGFSAPSGNEDPLQGFTLGASLSEERFDKAQVFVPLSYGFGGRNQLPSRISLEEYAPPRQQQGSQGSCVGWASAYAARTILQAKATGGDPAQLAFSPSYLYNQIRLEGCQGAYMLDAMRTMKQNGALPFRQFTYDESSCAQTPSKSEIAKARAYSISGYNRLTNGPRDYTPNILAIKQNLAQGAPVVIGMMVGGSFMSRMVGQDMWRPTSSDYYQRGFGGHAMCVIGYDDNYEGGAFQIMNSWGEKWGNKGNCWVKYSDFMKFTKEAYGLFPLTATEKGQSDKFEVEFGLADMNSKTTLALKKLSDLSFGTLKPLTPNDKFKVLFANSEESYVYVFGEETDGSSYVLFPYTEKHSPYCGITGTRLFPDDYSMSPDDQGNKDRIAIVVSKKELDYQAFNQKLNRSRQQTYAGKLREALGNDRIRNVNFRAGSTIAFSADAKQGTMVGMIIEVDK